MVFELEEKTTENRRDKDERTKNMLTEVTKFHLMLADVYCK